MRSLNSLKHYFEESFQIEVGANGTTPTLKWCQWHHPRCQWHHWHFRFWPVLKGWPSCWYPCAVFSFFITLLTQRWVYPRENSENSDFQENHCKTYYNVPMWPKLKLLIYSWCPSKGLSIGSHIDLLQKTSIWLWNFSKFKSQLYSIVTQWILHQI